jgi:hypothetical protein
MEYQVVKCKDHVCILHASAGTGAPPPEPDAVQLHGGGAKGATVMNLVVEQESPLVRRELGECVLHRSPDPAFSAHRALVLVRKEWRAERVEERRYLITSPRLHEAWTTSGKPLPPFAPSPLSLQCRGLQRTGLGKHDSRSYPSTCSATPSRSSPVPFLPLKGQGKQLRPAVELLVQ